jgi:hypothetical protein
MPSKTRGKGRAQEVVPEATLPLGKQLAHTGKSLECLNGLFYRFSNLDRLILVNRQKDQRPSYCKPQRFLVWRWNLELDGQHRRRRCCSRRFDFEAIAASSRNAKTVERAVLL